MSRDAGSTISDRQIAEAAEIIRQGGVVAFPTETVYGLGADALNAAAVAKLFALKGRPSHDPVIAHVAEPGQLHSLVSSVPSAAETLTARFWPGPLTLVLPKLPIVPDIVTAGLPSVAVRCPAHDVARRLIRAARVPIAAPSANRFGKISPTTAAHVAASFGDRTPLTLDAGPCQVGVESTVVSLVESQPRLLRPGGVTREELESVIGPVVVASAADAQPVSPGMLPEHYAPTTPLIIATEPIAPNTGRVGLLCLEPTANASDFAAVEVLSASGDLREAAANLYAALRRLDALQLDRIIAQPLPIHGLGHAIMDRLRRATHG